MQLTNTDISFRDSTLEQSFSLGPGGFTLCGRDAVPPGSESGRCLCSASDRAWAIPRIGCSLWPPRRAVGRRLGKMIAWVTGCMNCGDICLHSKLYIMFL